MQSGICGRWLTVYRRFPRIAGSSPGLVALGRDVSVAQPERGGGEPGDLRVAGAAGWGSSKEDA